MGRGTDGCPCIRGAGLIVGAVLLVALSGQKVVFCLNRCSGCRGAAVLGKALLLGRLSVLRGLVAEVGVVLISRIVCPIGCHGLCRFGEDESGPKGNSGRFRPFGTRGFGFALLRVLGHASLVGIKRVFHGNVPQNT